MKVVKRLTSVALGFSLICGVASAETLQFAFDATVFSSTLSTAPIGTDFKGTFSYDPATVAVLRSTVGGYAEYSYLPNSQISISIGDYFITSSIGTVALYSNGWAYFSSLPDNVTPVTVNGVIDPYAVINFSLPAPINSLTLPTSFSPIVSPYNPTENLYFSSEFAYFQSIAAIEFHVNSVTVVPEPSTYAMFFAGLAGLGYAARRNKKAAH